MKKKKAIVCVTNDLYTDQRVNKVCLFLVEEGYDLTLVGRKQKKSKELEPRIYKTKRFKLLFERGAKFYAVYNFRLFFYLLFHKSHLIVSNDLDTLLACYLAKKFKRKAILTYDTHEYFTEVPELIARPKVKRIWERIEGSIFPKLKHIYTVNHSIAQRYQEKYGKDLEVVRNISPKWEPKNILSKSELDLPLDKKIIILQGAGINIDRGAEEAVLAIQFIENALFLIVGDGDILDKLKLIVKDYELENKVLFKGKVPYQEMMNYTYHADLGLTLDKDTNLNYRFSLPNKVFDYIHTTTPVLASSVIEVKKVVTENNVGRIIENHDPKHIAEKINEIILNEDLLKELKENCKIAAEVENWENEKSVLRKIYSFN